MSKRRVVVTGLGILSPVGNTVKSTWSALLAGQSGIGLIDHSDTTAYAIRFAGLVKNFKDGCLHPVWRCCRPPGNAGLRHWS